MICESELSLWIVLVRNLLNFLNLSVASLCCKIFWCWHFQWKKEWHKMWNSKIKVELSQEGKLCSSNIHRIIWRLLMLFSCDRKPQKLWSLPCPDICRMIWILVVIESCEGILNKWCNGLIISACVFSWDCNDSNCFENNCIGNETSNW